MTRTARPAARRRSLALAVLGAAAIGGLGPAAAPARAQTSALTDAERRAGWRLLFDGHTTAGWRGYRSDSMPAGWRVADGTLTKAGVTGDIVTVEQFRDFELSLEWKIATGGNSGIFYRATEEYDHVYWSGPEYQLLDDANAPDGKSRLTAAGSDYGLYPSPPGIVKRAGEWNTTRIVVHGSHVEHWLNGRRLLAYDLGSPDWLRRVEASKFAAWPDYGRASRGHIGIQGDHSGSLAIRNVRIRTL